MARRSPGKVPDAVNDAITNNAPYYKNVMPQLQDIANSKPGIWSKMTGKAGTAAANAAVDAAAAYISGGNPIVELSLAG